MKKVICVVGPTASGKTKISIELAKRLNAEIISCDSVAVYKHLDIGSAKPTKEEMDGVTHHLIDVLDLDSQFDVSMAQSMARNIIDNTDKLQILCGGTGLYVQGIINQYDFTTPKRDDNFEEEYKEYSNQDLYDLLLKYDPLKAKELHMNNRKRVLRALHCSINGSNLSENTNAHLPYYDSYLIYLDIPRGVLYKRIGERVDKMIHDGLIDEAKHLYDNGYHIKAIGYQEFEPYFRGEVTLESTIDDIKLKTRHLAKRQKTWFKNQTNAVFYDVNLDNIDETINIIYNDVLEFLK